MSIFGPLNIDVRAMRPSLLGIYMRYQVDRRETGQGPIYPAQPQLTRRDTTGWTGFGTSS